MRGWRQMLVSLALLFGCAAEIDPVDPEEGFFEGEPADQNGRFDFKFDRPAPYDVPEDLPELVSPEVIVSLEGLTVHLFDRETGFSRVYPTGVGTLSGNTGRSITPTGHFTTHPNTRDGWYYIATRWEPAYFEGYPFLRLSATNSRGENTYGLHGPITNPLRRGYVSHGCMRMDKPDIVELFFIVRNHPETPVTIQQERELDAAGKPVDLDSDVTLWGVDDEIDFGESVGPRPKPRGFIGDPCAADVDCGGYLGASGTFCHPSGFCSQSCAGTCPDKTFSASTFCASDPGSERDGGVCLSRAEAMNGECADVEGSVPVELERYVGDSSAPAATALTCASVAAAELLASRDGGEPEPE